MLLLRALAIRLTSTNVWRAYRLVTIEYQMLHHFVYCHFVISLQEKEDYYYTGKHREETPAQ